MSKKMLRSGGEVLYNNLTKSFNHFARSKDRWQQNGLTVIPDMNLQILAKAKIEDLQNRTIDKEALPCIIPITASAELNSIMWQSLHSAMVDNKIRMLIDELDYELEVSKQKSYIQLTSYEKMLNKLPYVQTSLLVHEGINLKQEWKEGKIKLKEQRSGTKDRMVALSYGNYFFDILENKFSKNEQQGEFNEEDWYNIMII